MRGVLIIIALVLLENPASAGGDEQSGSYYLSACSTLNAVGIREFDSPPEAFQQGLCSGAMDVFKSYGKFFDFCIPPDTNTKVMAGVFIEYLKHNSDKQGRDFAGLAVTAFKQFWPCN